MLVDSWTPLGRAVLDYARGHESAAIEVTLEDGRIQSLPVHTLARTDGLPMAEEAALAACQGRVLDAGAGAGAHTLLLQDDGFDVVALDRSVDAVQAMRIRGVEDARCHDLLTLPGERFDTILLMMNGLGLAGDLEGLDRVLARLPGLLHMGGQVLVDGADIESSDDHAEQQLVKKRRAEGRYPGIVPMRMTYHPHHGDPAVRGKPFNWLFLDQDTLRWHAERQGWAMQILFDASGGSFLARLWRG